MNASDEGRHWKRLVELVPGACAIVTITGEFVSASRSFFRLLERSDVHAKSLSDVFLFAEGEDVGAFLRGFASSSTLTAGSLTVVVEGEEERCIKCRGGLLQASGAGAPVLLMIHFESREKAVEKFAALDEKLTQLSNEVQRRRQVEGALRELNEVLEARVEERTSELSNTHTALMEMSRKAGMSEVATGVLHNIGNVLNSVNISSTMVERKLADSMLSKIQRAGERIQSRIVDLSCVQSDDRELGKLVEYVVRACSAQMDLEREVIRETREMKEYIRSIKEIVAFQQEHAKHVRAIEEVLPRRAVEQSLKLYKNSLAREGIEIIEEYGYTASIQTDNSKLVQVLTNFIANARDAIRMSAKNSGHRLRISTRAVSEGQIAFSISDTGIGIPEEHLSNMFTHGFTTKPDGHGFGLHSCALHAQDLGGEIQVYSGGLDMGARFELILPIEPATGGESVEC